MDVEQSDLHGSAPDTADAVLLLIDVINDMEFDGGEDLFRYALPAAQRLSALKKRASEHGIPTVYANDNFGRWQSDFRKLVDHCLNDDVRGGPIAQLLAPQERDYFVLKPKHSGFFSTSLEVLLRYLGARALIIAGFATNICVLFTANDAYMRDYSLAIPGDCSAAESEQAHTQTLELMRTTLKADITESGNLDLGALNGGGSHR
jgi:nicotinamidase-related amidase